MMIYTEDKAKRLIKMLEYEQYNLETKAVLCPNPDYKELSELCGNASDMIKSLLEEIKRNEHV